MESSSEAAQGTSGAGWLRRAQPQEVALSPQSQVSQQGSPGTPSATASQRPEGSPASSQA